ncbi:MAG TPA: hypothetical protein VEU62_10520 [Bryobacterales bacterium]|nr:hypothetical protein [Bryobacterales bacterium]
MAVLAAPTLRLNTASLRPIWVQQGTNGPSNAFFEAYNIGDGSLNLQVKGAYPWLTPALGASQKCTFDASKTCLPIKVLLSASSLQPGAYSGVITVSDPNSYDAPQTVRVTIYVNGDVPTKLDLYLPPAAGTKDSATFQTPAGGPPSLKPTTQAGGNWLAVSSSGMGSFQFLYTHTVQVAVQNGMAAGDYAGSVAVAGSTFAADNRSFPVTLHVTAQPIARVSAQQLELTAVAGGAAAQRTVAVANGGQGTLTVSGATASGGSWLTASVQSDGTVKLSADPGSMAPGFYLGAVSIASNAANSPVTVPVELEVQAASGPLTTFGGVVDAAAFTAPVGSGALVSLFGSQLATGTAQAGAIPLPTTLADATVFVNDVAAPLIFASPGQINFQMPFEASGTVRVRVDRQGQRGNTITVQAATRAAGLFTFPGTGYAIAENASRGNGGVVFAVPDTPAFAGIPKGAARVGDVLVLFGSGLGPVSPAVATGTGAPSDTLATLIGNAQVAFSLSGFGPYAVPQFVGLTPGFVGLYQINVQVPPGVAISPSVSLRLNFTDETVSNTVQIAVEKP